MKKTPSDPADTAALRHRAEEKLQGKQKGRRKEMGAWGEQLEAQRLVHELQVHQIELEMQNDELRRALSEIEESRARYLNLYDFSPIGYFTFDRKGRIEAVNLTGASLLGMERQSLIKAPFPGFLHRDSLPVFSSHMEQVFTSGVKQTCELWLMLKNKNLLPVIMESILTEPAEGRPVQSHSAMIDISKRKQAEKQVFEAKQRLYALMQAVPVGAPLASALPAISPCWNSLRSVRRTTSRLPLRTTMHPSVR
jgi:PAS domain S-box-containing protein